MEPHIKAEEIKFIILSRAATGADLKDLPDDQEWLRMYAELIDDGFLDGSHMLDQNGSDVSTAVITGIKSKGREEYRRLLKIKEEQTLGGKSRKFAKWAAPSIFGFFGGILGHVGTDWIKHLVGLGK